MSEKNGNIILSLRNVSKDFKISRKLSIHAVNNVSFDLRKAEFFAIAGESGSGKSTLARTIMGLYQKSSGEIYFKGHEIGIKDISKELKKDLHRNMQIIFQDSAYSLNPRMQVEDIIMEPLIANDKTLKKDEMRDKVYEYMNLVGLSKIYAKKKPMELSGGQRQRVSIARSMILEPDLIIADESLASLDVSVQAQILNLFLELKDIKKQTFIFITHNLSLVKIISDRVAIMKDGQIVEMGDTEKIFRNPKSEYCRTLIEAIPRPRYED